MLIHFSVAYVSHKHYRKSWLWNLILIVILLPLSSCSKEWLNAKPDKSLVVPTTIEDYQNLLDNTNDIFNLGQPALGEIGSGDYYVNTNNWFALNTEVERNAHIWTQDVYQGRKNISDWDDPYYQVFNANIVLEGVNEIVPEPSAVSKWNNVKGSALFFRAFAFFNIAQIFAGPYNSSTAGADLGIPLRLTTNFNERSVRSSLQQTYARIIQDLKQSIKLLGDKPLYKSRPSRPAAYALLARTYLSMQDYDKALLYADSSLQINKALVNYNGISTAATYPITRYNDEVIFHSTLVNYSILSRSNLIVDSALYRMYEPSDLRKEVFFKIDEGKATFRGSYNGSKLLFGGLATDEMYLIRAECNARNGKISEALEGLNSLLETRWSPADFIPVTVANAEEALYRILEERRKELCFRGLRWTDLRRLNMDPEFADTLKREIDGQIYTLLPNSFPYTLPIPDIVITESGIPQNPR